uniref:PH domain-containing protein n=1 Tax=Lotharella globosa TaxID=91324 RepID=A0A7S4DFD9_9EUKA
MWGKPNVGKTEWKKGIYKTFTAEEDLKKNPKFEFEIYLEDSSLHVRATDAESFENWMTYLKLLSQEVVSQRASPKSPKTMNMDLDAFLA